MTEEADPRRIEGTLYPEEEALIQNVVQKRRQEFVAGRLCARRALGRLGVRDYPLLNGKDRSPIWPPGIVGSISHAEGYCGVVLARKKEFSSVGLDVEQVVRLEENSQKHVCTEDELSWINSLQPDKAKQNLVLIFSAKECLYKCQYEISRQWLNFHDVNITVHNEEHQPSAASRTPAEVDGDPSPHDRTIDTGEFEARLLVDAGDYLTRGTRLKGKYRFHGGYVFTGMTLPNSINPGII